jgi:NOL1/NOP2/fmu family ribosome biogenesis protein
MFTWLNKQGVRSDKGFEVQFTGRFDAEYREGNKVVELYVESGGSGSSPSVILEPQAFVRWRDGEQISPEQQEKMFHNFQEAMAFQGLKMVVEKGE